LDKKFVEGEGRRRDQGVIEGRRVDSASINEWKNLKPVRGRRGRKAWRSEAPQVGEWLQNLEELREGRVGSES
jgi:hypothetical protein